MPVHFTCPHCGQLLSVTRRKVGQPVQCVRCQGGVLVPPPPDLDEPLVDPPSSDVELESYQPLATSSSILSRDQNEESTIQDPTAQPLLRTNTVAIPRSAIYVVGGLLAGVATVAFLLGWSFGSELSGQKQGSSQNSARRVSGRITYVTNRGKAVPDSEAVIVAFPTKRKPDEKIPPAAMRPNIAPANVPPSLLNSVRSLGGDFARTDRNGTYQLELSSPGEYYLLAISNHRSRGSRQPTTREVVEIGQFVTRATELLENNDYSWSKVMVAKSLLFNHVFEE